MGEMGVCPAAKEARVDGINGGTNGGRACWPFAGTLCDLKPHGEFSTKLGACLKCGFYDQVMNEEGDQCASVWEIISQLD